jgi:iron complex outermembrane receptor protein
MITSVTLQSRVWVSTGAGVLLGLVGFGAPAFAADPDGDSNTGRLEEIVVTAQKRAENVQDVPIAISVLSRAELENAKLDNPTGLTQMVPNLQVNGVNGDSVPLYSLRGVSMFDYSFSQSSPVASYFDEVYKGNFAILGLELYDIERVEVLRGPQGTLYGKNTTGGAINFIAAKPTFEPEGAIRIGIGNYNRREAEGALSGPLVGKELAGRVSFTYAKADGWFKNVLAGHPDLDSVDQWAVRTQLLFQPSEGFSMNLRFAMSRQRPQNYGILAKVGPFGVGGGPAGGLDPGYFRTIDGSAGGKPLADDQIAMNETRKRIHDTDSWALTTKWNASPGFDLTSITSYDYGKLFSPEGSDGSPVSILRAIYFGRTTQFTEDLRLTSSLQGPLNYIVGAFYQHESVFNKTQNHFYDVLDPAGGGDVCAETGFFGCDVANAFDQIRNSWAVYADSGYAMTDRVKLRAGLRYSHDGAALRNFRSDLLAPNATPLLNLIPGDPADPEATLSRDLSNSATSGKIGLDWTPARDALVYVTYSRGYRSGAFNAQAFFSPDEVTVVRPETLDLIEAGFKTQWLDRRLQLNGAVFGYEYKNQQIVDIDPATVQQHLLNLGKSRTTGIEVEMVAAPAPALQIRGSASLLHARFRDATVLGQSINGRRLPNAPDFSATLAVDWNAWAGERFGLAVHIDGSYQSSQFFEVLNVPRLEQAGYGIVNGRVAMKSAGDRWEVGIWGRNLTDEFYVTNALSFLDGFDFDYQHRGAPRTFGIDLSYRL